MTSSADLQGHRNLVAAAKAWLFTPLLVAVSVVALASCLPVRLDRRIMQDVARLQDAGVRP